MSTACIHLLHDWYLALVIFISMLCYNHDSRNKSGWKKNDILLKHSSSKQVHGIQKESILSGYSWLLNQLEQIKIIKVILESSFSLPCASNQRISDQCIPCYEFSVLYQTQVNYISWEFFYDSRFLRFFQLHQSVTKLLIRSRSLAESFISTAIIKKWCSN